MSVKNIRLYARREGVAHTNNAKKSVDQVVTVIVQPMFGEDKDENVKIGDKIDCLKYNFIFYGTDEHTVVSVIGAEIVDQPVNTTETVIYDATTDDNLADDSDDEVYQE